jgi:tol-pal system beta propeller repeat protein TolB
VRGRGLLAVLLVVTVISAQGAASSDAGAVAIRGRLVFAAIPTARGAHGYQLFRANGDGSHVRRLTHHAGDTSPSWSPKGSRVVYERVPDCNPRACTSLWIVAANGKRAHPITARCSDCAEPDWAANGNRIAYAWGPSRLARDIYVMASNGRSQRRLTKAKGGDEDPAWSPNGKQIAFSSERDGDARIYLMNADGTNQRPLTTASTGSEYMPAWSPDGKRIAFSRWSSGAAIVLINADGTDERILSPPDVFDVHPAWSPDGSKIAFVTGIGDDEKALWVMTSDGRNRRRFVHGPFIAPGEIDWIR